MIRRHFDHPLVVLAAVCLALLLVGCAPFAPTVDQAASDVASMRFVRHPSGLCFGVVRFNSYAGYQGVSVTHVPSEACKP